MKMSRITLIAIVCSVLGCAKTSTVAPSLPEHAPPAKTTEPPPPPADVPEEYAELLERNTPRWLIVEKLRKDAAGGWATGNFIAEANKIVIDTDGVERFVLHLDRIELDWTRRVVLRIDGANSELTRKRYPTLRLQRSPGGAWSAVTD